MKLLALVLVPVTSPLVAAELPPVALPPRPPVPVAVLSPPVRVLPPLSLAAVVSPTLPPKPPVPVEVMLGLKVMVGLAVPPVPLPPVPLPPVALTSPVRWR
jgi:hypothetical protein